MDDTTFSSWLGVVVLRNLVHCPLIPSFILIKDLGGFDDVQ